MFFRHKAIFLYHWDDVSRHFGDFFTENEKFSKNHHIHNFHEKRWLHGGFEKPSSEFRLGKKINKKGYELNFFPVKAEMLLFSILMSGGHLGGHLDVYSNLKLRVNSVKKRKIAKC